MKNKNIVPVNEKDNAQGYWETYWRNGLWYKCFYDNGKRITYSEIYPNEDNITLKKSFYI